VVGNSLPTLQNLVAQAHQDFDGVFASKRIRFRSRCVWGRGRRGRRGSLSGRGLLIGAEPAVKVTAEVTARGAVWPAWNRQPKFSEGRTGLISHRRGGADAAVAKNSRSAGMRSGTQGLSERRRGKPDTRRQEARKPVTRSPHWRLPAPAIALQWRPCNAAASFQCRRDLPSN
jgi:hypothetical protein